MAGRAGRRALVVAVVLSTAVVTGCGHAAVATDPTVGTASESVLGPDQRATGAPVRIGLVNVEGGSAVSLPDVGDAAEAAARYANDHLGGLAGHLIDVERCADHADGVSGAACAQQFIRDGVVAVVAGQPASADEIVPPVLRAGIPWFAASPSATSEFGSADPILIASGFLGTMAAWAQYSRDAGYRAVTLFGSDNPQLVGAVDTIGKPLFAGAGITLRFVAVPFGAHESTSQITAGLATDPDAVIIVADTGGCRSMLTALDEARSTVPKLVNSACVARSVIDAVGEAVYDNAVVFDLGDPSGTHPEAQLYRAVMRQYAPSADPSGITLAGYLSMLSLIRAVNKAGITGEPTPASLTTALRTAHDVPRPLGDGSTFSCDHSALPARLIKATVCSSELLYADYTGATPGRYSKIDTAPTFRSLVGG